jgi:hypothetical protein
MAVKFIYFLLLDNSMEQNPSEVNSASVSQKIPHILWCMKVQYHQVFNNPQGTQLAG